ncbi:hypothetical protein F5B18DRAFT_668034 [Nemania serpens]|nr:hypothetical protein F5B18DRAFT_668034 [Nemania serpens]
MPKKLLKIKPIIVYGHEGPVVAQVVIVIKELNLPYELQPLTADAPALRRSRRSLIYDPNGDLYLWEPHAIVSYLVTTYDDYLKISFMRDKDWFYMSDEWHSFQVDLMATTRVFRQLLEPGTREVAAFTNEVVGGLETIQEALIENMDEVIYMDDGKTRVTNGPWLVNNKMSYADLAICCWIYYVNRTSPQPIHLPYPFVSQWFEKVLSRGEVRSTFASLMPRR